MRPDERRDARVAAIGGLLGASFAAELLVPSAGPAFLVPIIAAAIWFGRTSALQVGVLASILLAGAIVLDGDDQYARLILSVPLFLFLGHLVGGLVERQRDQERELDRLRSIQNALAPQSPPDLPLLEFATRYLPAERGVAGDFYLVAEAHNNSTVVVVADVAGKGLAAAKRATFVRATLTASAPYSDDPVHLLRIANAELVRQHGVSVEFITMLCMVVRPDGTLVWSTAGHPPPLSLEDGMPIGEPRPAYPLGIAPELPAVPSQGRLPDAGILLYTDGLTDARPASGRYEPFGAVRVARAIRELRDPTPEQAVESLSRAAQKFARGHLPDDLCLVALRSKLPPWWGRDAGEREPSLVTSGA